MKINFKDFVLTDIDGEKKYTDIEAEKPYKFLANIIYNSAKNLDLVDIAMQINRGEEVDLQQDHIQEIKDLIKNSDIFYSFAKKQLLDFIKETNEKSK